MNTWARFRFNYVCVKQCMPSWQGDHMCKEVLFSFPCRSEFVCGTMCVFIYLYSMWCICRLHVDARMTHCQAFVLVRPWRTTARCRPEQQQDVKTPFMMGVNMVGMAMGVGFREPVLKTGSRYVQGVLPFARSWTTPLMDLSFPPKRFGKGFRFGNQIWMWIHNHLDLDSDKMPIHPYYLVTNQVESFAAQFVIFSIHSVGKLV